METATATELLSQHTVMVQTLTTIYVALVVACFLLLLMILVIAVAAALSVRAVSKQQAAVVEAIQARQGDLEGKFSLLIDLLLEEARQRNTRSLPPS